MATRKFLTDANVSDLKPREKKYEVWDGGDRGVHGFCVRVEVSGKKTFYCVYSFSKRTRWLRIGPFPILSVTEARNRAKKKLGEVADGKDPQAERTAKRGELTFELLHARYLDEHAKIHNKSWRRPC